MTKILIKKFLLKALLVAALLNSASCELTKSLWENSYEEEIEFFLVSADGYNVAFLGEKYHYIFNDDTGLMKELLTLDRQKTIMINTDSSYLKLDQANNITGYIYFKTFDLNLTPEQFDSLYNLGFKQSDEAKSLNFKLSVTGKRYLSAKDFNQYFQLLDDRYVIKIFRHSGIFRRAEDVALTPITLVADTLMLFGEVVITPFED